MQKYSLWVEVQSTLWGWFGLEWEYHTIKYPFEHCRLCKFNDWVWRRTYEVNKDYWQFRVN